jgi:hypothetical protein
VPRSCLGFLLDCDWGDCEQCERGTVAAVLYSWSRLELRGVVRVFSRPELCLLLSMSQAFKDASQPGGSRRLVPGVTSSADRCSSVGGPATATVTVPTRSRAMDDTSRVKPPPTVHSTCLATSCEVRFATLRSVFCHTTKYLVRRTLINPLVMFPLRPGYQGNAYCFYFRFYFCVLFCFPFYFYFYACVLLSLLL